RRSFSISFESMVSMMLLSMCWSCVLCFATANAFENVRTSCSLITKPST
ncbi:hypothetical protein D049_1203B, partial [Vibrio parahaemolyticus VPTS-2010]